MEKYVEKGFFKKILNVSTGKLFDDQKTQLKMAQKTSIHRPPNREERQLLPTHHRVHGVDGTNPSPHHDGAQTQLSVNHHVLLENLQIPAGSWKSGYMSFRYLSP